MNSIEMQEPVPDMLKEAIDNSPKRIACRILTSNAVGQKHEVNTVIKDASGKTYFFDERGAMRHCLIRPLNDGSGNVSIIPLVKRKRRK